MTSRPCALLWNWPCGTGSASERIPGTPTGMRFGRRERTVTAGEVRELVLTQTRSLQGLALAQNTVLRHVKPHGALYNQAARDPVLAGAVVDAVAELGAELVLFAPAGSVP